MSIVHQSDSIPSMMKFGIDKKTLFLNQNVSNCDLFLKLKLKPVFFISIKQNKMLFIFPVPRMGTLLSIAS